MLFCGQAIERLQLAALERSTFESPLPQLPNRRIGPFLSSVENLLTLATDDRKKSIPSLSYIHDYSPISVIIDVETDRRIHSEQERWLPPSDQPIPNIGPYLWLYGMVGSWATYPNATILDLSGETWGQKLSCDESKRHSAQPWVRCSKIWISAACSYRKHWFCDIASSIEYFFKYLSEGGSHPNHCNNTSNSS